MKARPWSRYNSPPTVAVPDNWSSINLPPTMRLAERVSAANEGNGLGVVHALSMGDTNGPVVICRALINSADHQWVMHISTGSCAMPLDACASAQSSLAPSCVNLPCDVIAGQQFTPFLDCSPVNLYRYGSPTRFTHWNIPTPRTLQVTHHARKRVPYVRHAEFRNWVGQRPLGVDVDELHGGAALGSLNGRCTASMDGRERVYM